MCALGYLDLPHTLTSVQPSKLKKQVPAPHLVPVMKYNDQVVVDSAEILKFLDRHHGKSPRQLYPDVSAGATKHWSSVAELEKFSHDNLSMYYYYFGGISDYGIQNVTKPFMRRIMPKPLVTILPFLPGLAAKGAASSLRRRVAPLLGAKTIASDAAAKKGLIASLKKLEACFENDKQKYLFATSGPTAADFGIFAALKRLLDPIPEIAPGLTGGYPNCVRDAGGLPRLQSFFENMNDAYYQGKIDWSSVPLKL
ncbi:Thioredoxin-like protein [Gracilaria domingensis]|nr:Thioredoxin-like protein [Gracilaria domingensis]